MQVLIKPLLKKGSVKLIKPIYHPSYSSTHGKFKNLCFISVAPMVYVSRAFVYNVVDVKKIVAISSIKPPSYAYARVTAGINHTLIDLPIHGEHRKPNPNFVY